MTGLPIPKSEIDRLLAITLLRAEQAEADRNEAQAALADARALCEVTQQAEREAAAREWDAKQALVGLREAAEKVSAADRGMGSWWVDREQMSPAEQRYSDAIDALRSALVATPDPAPQSERKRAR